MSREKRKVKRQAWEGKRRACESVTGPDLLLCGLLSPSVSREEGAGTDFIQVRRSESACDAGDPSSIPGSGRSPGERIGYPLQYSWASLVAQLVKNLPAMRETWVRSLGWEGPLEKGMATHSSILPWTVWRLQRVRHS